MEKNEVKRLPGLVTGVTPKEEISTGNKISHFILDEIVKDTGPGGRLEGLRVHTRFPPEPNGYLHIGHAKAIIIDFGTAELLGGLCNLRMDDTNPVKEDETFVQAIKDDIHWLGYDWSDRFFHASDYFEEIYLYAEELIRKDLAFVCEQTPEEVRQARGTLTTPGTESPWRNRPLEESLDLFRRMRAGEFPDGRYTLRAKIDMSDGNMNMRDPVIYRIQHASHHQTGDRWCIYPMYDFAHPISDSLEHITHSLCSLEFEDHRPLYDWVINNCSLPVKSRQIEFARLDINYTVMSKRKLRALIEEGLVDGWDDPRLPTLCGLRRRGYTPRAIRDFNERNGVSKVPSMVDIRFLEHCLREDLNKRAPRAMAVLDPIRLTLTNYPENQEETFALENLPGDPNAGTHDITFSRHLLIERSDFEEVPPKKYYRLFPGNLVRLRGAYMVRCTGCVKDSRGRVIEVLAEYDPGTRGGTAADGQKVRGTIHWLDEATAIEAEVRLYDHLFTVEAPDDDERDYHELLNPDSLTVIETAFVEPWLKEDRSYLGYQFMRLGYFIHDSHDTSENKLVFNRSVKLKDSYRPD
ncbi:MAG TPA: glutamine--tRNA ligase/YqeY domain fusion protein [Bacillota bacterium]|jgi:glutaminyl-tRNA synthetase|nr:glutamine--tRNA ligase/YqeY domain fusion protein [Fastidiosipila sp.]HPX92822.1 glutamine--tRNA ligase/YqeY domain fusion protein [Bacillota bacterium]HQB81307.1 glutamine--tRNA ligase/YqeY domain fusion protein [Bacillota bacterium]